MCGRNTVSLDKETETPWSYNKCGDIYDALNHLCGTGDKGSQKKKKSL